MAQHEDHTSSIAARTNETTSTVEVKSVICTTYKTSERQARFLVQLLIARDYAVFFIAFMETSPWVERVQLAFKRVGTVSSRSQLTAIACIVKVYVRICGTASRS